MDIDRIELVNIEALVMDSINLGFDLILEINAIRAMGGITITPTGVISFAGRKVFPTTPLQSVMCHA